MPKISRFQRQTTALFFIVSLVPALSVVAVWYFLTQVGPAEQLELTFADIVFPVFIIGLMPAFVMSFVFAELLARPVRAIHQAALDLSQGKFGRSSGPIAHGEFGEIEAALGSVSAQLDRMLSETTGETKLIEAERNKLQGVLNSMTDGVFALDQGGRIILFNKAASVLTGHSIGDVAGQLAEKVLPLRLDGELVMARWLATRHGTGDEVGRWRELELYRRDGTSLFVAVQAVVLQDDPNGIRALITFHDLTRDHQLEEMKIDFVALAAHELRTPITEIKGYLDILGHEATGLNAENRRWLDRSINSASELSSLINNLLNVARIEHGDVSAVTQPIDYLKHVTYLMPGYETMLSKRGLDLRLEVNGTIPAVMADPQGVTEVLNNYVSNACDHTPAGGTVTIRVKARGHEVDTTVTDTGSGIPESAKGRLFSKFYRVSEFKARTRGTGLGLYISKSIIEAQKGHVWVESVEGQGSTFGFSLRKTTIAPNDQDGNNNTNIMRGPHGWIKSHSVR